MPKSLLCALFAAGLALSASPASNAAAKTDFDICWTIYAGWMPWEYAAAEGIVDKLSLIHI